MKRATGLQQLGHGSAHGEIEHVAEGLHHHLADEQRQISDRDSPSMPVTDS